MNIRVQQVSVTFKDAQGGLVPALGTLSLNIPSGQFVAVLGASGCGKSTLIRAIAGLQMPTLGQVYLNEKLVSKPDESVGLMFQEPNLMAWRTVADNIALPLELSGMSASERMAKVHPMIERLGLTTFTHAYPKELSGGMAQRVALGRVLMRQPKVLLLDEPFGALDALTREKISFDVLQLWQEQQQTAIMVTHDIQEAVMMANRVIVLSRRPGQIIADIPITLDVPRHPEVIYQPDFIAFVREARQALMSA
jgi:NitT/TauT family transport system ATP-binding protein